MVLDIVPVKGHFPSSLAVLVMGLGTSKLGRVDSVTDSRTRRE